MEKSGYTFLFPYEKVPCNSKIVIYGAGKMGQSYLQQIKTTNYCSVVALADRNYKEYDNPIIPVCSPKDIHKFEFDYVVIALRAQVHKNEFYDNLLEQGIRKDQIVYVGERPKTEDVTETFGTVINSVPKGNVVISMMGGFGDYLLQKKFIEMIVELDNKIKIDIYCSRNIDFLNYIFREMKQINFIEYNLGCKYNSCYMKYDAAIFLAGTGLIVKIDNLKQDSVSINASLYGALEKIKDLTDLIDFGLAKPTFIECFRSIYRNENCFKRLSFGSILPLGEEKVHIPEGIDTLDEYRRIGLKKYITLNFGNGDTHNTLRVAKSWPKKNFEIVIEMIKATYSDIEIVQIGADGAERLSGVDRTFFGKSFSLVSNILKNAILHIDIEGGMVHFATNLGTKCIVLFGPTQVEYYGYEQNINIKAGNCHNCYGLYPDVNKCARGLEQPECMYSITPALVLEELNKYLSTKSVLTD